ncbi:uncharacterized protein PV09_01996 [Verruconis gallopava]|uniref:Amino acid permease/ SLC12A domain-containing protein n=1 Tax=Verruconis gallopava TaxID=253628 RepID=A0A0D2AJT2_9PEZI|nr:uncharacterized protein PV09_01996 [Verruconis gallopava]KIW07123.1 hypothetical protein PV09_01996 [Verruconis gallopava]
MMCFSQSLGIGLFLQNGRAIHYAGPGLATLAYFLAGTVIWSSAACLGEMTALFPIKGPIYQLPKRFLDESVGYAAAWMTWFGWIVLIAAELVAITHMFHFNYPKDLLEAAHYPTSSLSFSPSVAPAVLILAFIPVVLLLNFLPVKHFGQLEYLTGCVKMIFLIMMIVMNTVLHSMERVPGEKRFWTYNEPYSWAASNITLADRHSVVTGGVGRLAGLWEAMTTAIFGLIGVETVAITAAENKDLRNEETVKIATRKICLRLILLYTLATFTVGLNVPYTYPTISDPSVISFGYGENSAFVVSMVLNRLNGWPLVVNNFVIFSALSAGINGCYNASRTLHALASDRNAWPDWSPVQALRTRLERTHYGVPYVAVLVSWLFGWLAFLGSTENSAVVLGRLVRCVTVAILIVYGVVCLTYLEFYNIAHAANGDDENVNDKDDPEVRQQFDRNSAGYPYKSHGQWLRACFALSGCFLLVFFNGWRSLTPPVNTGDFLGCYISILIFMAFIVMYQIKFHGWNPLNWRRRASRELQNPQPLVVTNLKRRGRINLESTDTLFTVGNFNALLHWLWIWLK